MTRASFRVYAQLNDFLPREHRGRRFAHETAGHSTLKDTIESLGIPHPEVDLLVVNGRVVDFDHRLDDGDQVAVYPRFCSLPLDDGQRLSAPVPTPARFVADVHLAALTARLRLAGFDVVTALEDEDVALQSGRDARIALTRDRELLKRKAVRAGCWIRNTDPDAQFVEVLRRFDLAHAVKPFTRCLRCNAILRETSKADAADRLPPAVAAAFDEFRDCPSCHRVYWRGSHHDRLQRRLEQAVAAAQWQPPAASVRV